MNRPIHAAKPCSIICLCAAVTLAPSVAHAYIDPVTGSFIIQGIIAGVMAVLAGIRRVRERIVALFTSLTRRKDKDN